MSLYKKYKHTRQAVLLVFILIGCQQIKPTTVEMSGYPDFKSLMENQVNLLGGKQIKKKVSLGGQSEFKVIQMDSAELADELSFLKEMNPNQAEYVGAFEQSVESDMQILQLKASEKGPLKKVVYERDGDQFKTIQIVFHENKDVYVHHRDVEMEFKRGAISKIGIEGYQKMMFKDTVKFGISIEIN